MQSIANLRTDNRGCILYLQIIERFDKEKQRIKFGFFLAAHLVLTKNAAVMVRQKKELNYFM